MVEENFFLSPKINKNRTIIRLFICLCVSSLKNSKYITVQRIALLKVGSGVSLPRSHSHAERECLCIRKLWKLIKNFFLSLRTNKNHTVVRLSICPDASSLKNTKYIAVLRFIFLKVNFAVPLTETHSHAEQECPGIGKLWMVVENFFPSPRINKNRTIVRLFICPSVSSLRSTKCIVVLSITFLKVCLGVPLP